MATVQQAFQIALQHHQAGRLAEAEALYGQILAAQPNHADALHLLGVVAHQDGRNDVAVGLIRRAIALSPRVPDFHSNLGEAFRAMGRLREAIAEFQEAIALKPGFPEAHYNLGIALHMEGRLDDAVTSVRQATILRPSYSEAYNNLGGLLKTLGRLDEAVLAYRQAIAINPNFTTAWNNLINTLHFHPGFDSRAIAEELCKWYRQFAEPLRGFMRFHTNERSIERRLRIGYVSPDFRSHVICHFLTPLLEAHDESRVEIYCYASVEHPDTITERMRKCAAVWRDVLRITDEALAHQIREDRIDILVDLSQHTLGNRLLAFSRKPAPVQVAWLGYPGSTGLEAIDYRFTDAFMEPEDAAWSKSVERPVRLLDSWFCFDPIDAYPEPGPLPARGGVTFGSLNNIWKINEGVLQLWAQVLQSVDGSRLLMQCPAGSTQARVRQWFEAQGIAAHRLELVSRTATRAEFLQLFGRIDIALETFPYNGGTTTCEALWMGVPVPTFPGTTAVSRIGLSILSAAGLQELIAAGQEDYVRLVVSLATDLPRLAEWRSTLRQRMKTSAFMDAPRFARNMEAAYRAMWRRWCAESVS